MGRCIAPCQSQCRRVILCAAGGPTWLKRGDARILAHHDSRRGCCRWVEEYHVDGFRFDLASALCRDPQGQPMTAPPLIRDLAKDPVLSKVCALPQHFASHAHCYCPPDSRECQEWAQSPALSRLATCPW